MGFGTIVANVVMFISVLLLSTAAIGSMKDVVVDSTNSMQIQSKELSNNIKTNFQITSAIYNHTTDNLTIYCLNTGKTTLDISYVDAFVDDIFIDRDNATRTIEVQPSTDTKNTGLWDPTEYIVVVISKALGNSSTHTASIVGPYGNRADKDFS